MSEKLKRALTSGLLAFVLISIGYAVGKEVTLHRLAGRVAAAGPATAPASGEKVVVYYMHPTLRCVTCNVIEKAAEQAVREDLAEFYKAGRVEWHVVNIDENEPLAERYNVASSTLVVVRIRDGEEIDFEHLDKVWELTDSPGELRAYVAGKVRACFPSGHKESS